MAALAHSIRKVIWVKSGAPPMRSNTYTLEPAPGIDVLGDIWFGPRLGPLKCVEGIFRAGSGRDDYAEGHQGLGAIMAVALWNLTRRLCHTEGNKMDQRLGCKRCYAATSTSETSGDPSLDMAPSTLTR